MNARSLIPKIKVRIFEWDVYVITRDLFYLSENVTLSMCLFTLSTGP